MSLDYLLKQALVENSLHLTPLQVNKILSFLALLTEWNKVINLTAITDPKEMIYLHVIDSLMIKPYLKGKICLDVGSGCGVPGILLAILDETKTWVLLDKNRKKTHFLTEVAALLPLPNVTVVNNTAENYHPPVLFDTIISRAYGSLNYCLESSAHLIKPEHGFYLAMKGKLDEEELNVTHPGFKLPQVFPLFISGIKIERHLVCFQAK